MKKYVFILIAIVFSLSSCATRVVTPSAKQTNVVVVKKTPKNYRIVRVKGKKYYYWNGNYHRKTRAGYTVVKIN